MTARCSVFRVLVGLVVLLLPLAALAAGHEAHETEGEMEVEAEAAMPEAAAPPALGICEFPPPPRPTDAEAILSNAELKVLSDEIRTFMAEGEAYNACLSDYEHALDPADKTQRALVVQAHNAMVEAMQASADAFNVTLRASMAARESDDSDE